MQVFLHFPQIVAIFYEISEFSEFCCIFGTLHFEKSSNTAKNVSRKWRKFFQLHKYLFYYVNGRFWNQKCSQWNVDLQHRFIQNRKKIDWCPLMTPLHSLSHFWAFLKSQSSKYYLNSFHNGGMIGMGSIYILLIKDW